MDSWVWNLNDREFGALWTAFFFWGRNLSDRELGPGRDEDLEQRLGLSEGPFLGG